MDHYSSKDIVGLSSRRADEDVAGGLPARVQYLNLM